MKKSLSHRRKFLQQTALTAGTFGLASFTASATKVNDILDTTANDRKLHIVCMGAHPGDPEFGCGGTMAKYSDAGHKVSFLYLTKGEASDPSVSHADMAAMRTKEAATACKILNAIPLFAGQIDGDTVLDKKQNDTVSKMLLDQQPDIVFAQWPVDAHADHQVTGLLALTAWVRAERKFDLYFYEVNTGVETMAFTPTDYVDITTVQERKKQAMFAHKTQNPVETYNDYFKPLETFRGLECGVKAAEAFIHFKAAGARASIVGL